VTVFLSILLAAWLSAAAQSGPGQAESLAKESLEKETLLRLLDIRRVYVDRLGGGDAAAQVRDMIISSLQATKLYIITESEEKADAFLRGSAEDLIFTDTFSSSDSLSARASAGTGSNPDRTVEDRRSRSASVTVGEQESTRIAERKHEATAAVRLVSKDGDVLWATVQESFGAKFLGASADVAQKIAKQLLKDYHAAKQLRIP
jgi:hypothetical protein